jgi:hypothetical protein
MTPDRRLGPQALARAALTYLAEPADPALGALLGICEPAEVLAAIKAGVLPGTGPGCGDSPASRRALERHRPGGWLKPRKIPVHPAVEPPDDDPTRRTSSDPAGLTARARPKARPESARQTSAAGRLRVTSKVRPHRMALLRPRKPDNATGRSVVSGPV